MASQQTGLMTFEEFARLPESGFRQELHHGELVEMPPPVYGHQEIQKRLLKLIDAAAGGAGEAMTEFGFKPVARFEYRIADVAYLSRELAAKVPKRGYLEGVPELVIEVLLPSNSAREMIERRNICLQNGGIQFWIVDDVERTVEVWTTDLRSIVYKSGQCVPLFFALNTRVNTGINDGLLVDSIFD